MCQPRQPTDFAHYLTGGRGGVCWALCVNVYSVYLTVWATGHISFMVGGRACTHCLHTHSRPHWQTTLDLTLKWFRCESSSRLWNLTEIQVQNESLTRGKRLFFLRIKKNIYKTIFPPLNDRTIMIQFLLHQSASACEIQTWHMEISALSQILFQS